MPVSFIRPAAIGLACALASPAGAQLLTEKSLSAAMAMTIAQTALDTCTKQGYNVSVHVLGRNGEVLVAVRGDGAPPHTAAAHHGEQPAQGLYLAHVSDPLGRICPARQGQSHNRRGTPH